MSMLSDLVTQALGLPEWAPRALRRAAAALIIGTAVGLPAAFQQGVIQFADQEARRITERFVQPMLDRLESGGNASRQHGSEIS